MKIPVAKPYLGKEEADAAAEAVLSGWVTQGPRVQKFEEAFASYVKAPHAVATSNCTTALHLAWIVLGIQPGDEVICPSLSFIATANSIRYVGATPVFAEVNPKNYNLSLEDVVRKITPKTKAVLLVHQMGIPAEVEKFQAICREHRLALVEDAACAIGSSYQAKPIGSHSDLVCFSFHPRKVITTGDGGMVTTPNAQFAARMKRLRQHGMSISDQERHRSNQVLLEEYVELGYNYRMTDIQAAVGLKQLERLDSLVQDRLKIYETYRKELSGIAGIEFPEIPAMSTWNVQSLPVYFPNATFEKRNALMQKLLEIGVSTRRGIMCAHREAPYRSNEAKLPVSEKLSDQSMILPLYVPMSEAEVDYVIQNFRKFLS